MTISKADRYTEISRYLLEEAWQQLDRGDLIQASEKAWGATAHAVKSLAQTRGWNHTRHDLHNNFYEHAMTPTQVRGAINDAVALIEELHTLRQQTPRPFDHESRDQQTRLRKLTRRPPPTEDDVSDLPPVRPVPPQEAD